MFKVIIMSKYMSVLLLVLLSSCASNQLHRGVVAMKVSDTEAHVGLGKSEAVVGDHVELYRNVCVNRGSIGSNRGLLAKDLTEQYCKKVAQGHGRVTAIINDDYATVQFDSGVKFEAGDFIEKHSH